MHPYPPSQFSHGMSQKSATISMRENSFERGVLVALAIVLKRVLFAHGSYIELTLTS
jgi:hypothetical protein